jgi:hypothetical protein
MPPVPNKYVTGDIVVGMTLVSDLMPQFIGGDSAMRKFVSEKLEVIDYATYNDSFPRKILVRATIDTTGQTKDIKIVKGGLDSAFNTLIVNSIAQMPKWKPGKLRTRVVASKILIPIKIKRKE